MAWCTTGRISVATTWSSLLIGIEYKSNFGIINLTNKIIKHKVLTFSILFKPVCDINIIGLARSSKDGESNTNCIWGGGSCYTEDGEYSWVR